MKTPLILLAASCAGALLALGICGQAHGDNEAVIGVVVLGISAVAFVVALLWMLGRFLMGGSK